MPDNTLAIRIAATNEAGPAFAEVAAGATKLKESVGEGGLEGALAKLKENFGRGSEIKESLELLRGAGVVAGLGVGAELLDRLTEKAKEFAVGLKDGEIPAAAIPDKLLSSIPIFGQIYDAAQNVKEIIAGTADEEAVLVAGTKAQAIAAADVLATYQQYRTAADDAKHSIGEMSRAIGEIGLTGDEAKKQKIIDDGQKFYEQADEKRKAAKEAADKQADEAQAKLIKDSEGQYAPAMAALTEQEYREKMWSEAKGSRAKNQALQNLQAANEEVEKYRETIDAKKQIDLDAKNLKAQADRNFSAEASERNKLDKAQYEQAKIEADERHKEMGAKAATDEAKSQADIKIAALHAQSEASYDATVRAVLDEQAARLQIESETEGKIAQIKEETRKKKIAQKGDVDLNNADESRQIADVKAKESQELAEAASRAARAGAEARNAQLDKQIAGEKDLREVREQGMQIAAEAGDRQAKQALDLARIQDKYIEDADRLRKILADPAAAQALKQQAAAQLSGLQAQEKQALKQETPAREHIGVEIPDDASHLTGRNLGNLNSTEDPNIEANKATAAATKDLAAFYATFITPNGSLIAQLLQKLAGGQTTGIIQPGG